MSFLLSPFLFLLRSSLSLTSGILLMTCFGVGFFLFLMLIIHCASWICLKIFNFSVIISSPIFSVHLSFSSLRILTTHVIGHSTLSYNSLMFFPFFKTLFSLCVSLDSVYGCLKFIHLFCDV